MFIKCRLISDLGSDLWIGLVRVYKGLQTDFFSYAWLSTLPICFRDICLSLQATTKFWSKIPHLLPQNSLLNSSVAVGLLSPCCQLSSLQLLFIERVKSSKCTLIKQNFQNTPRTVVVFASSKAQIEKCRF